MSWFSTSGMTATIFKWMTSLWLWFVVILLVLFAIYFFLWLRRRRKLKFPVIEQTSLGGGKVGMKMHVGGWFKSKSMIFGMYDYGGEDQFRLQDGRLILEASSEDYHDIMGRRGLIVSRKSDDPKVLVPISKLVLDKESHAEIMSIAPADYRDASSKISAQSENETMGKFERYLPWISLMVIGMVFIIGLILIIQLMKGSETEAAKLILEAGKQRYAECANVLASGAP